MSPPLFLRRLALLVIFSVLLPSLCAASSKSEGVVHWVIDGDTFELKNGQRIRLIGVDSPEYQPWKRKPEFYGKEASLYLRHLLNKKKVRLQKDAQAKDNYGRTLAYVYLENGEFVNLLLVQKGYAKAKNYPPNNRYRDLLKKAQQEAKQNKRGLWNRAKTAQVS